MAYVDTGAYDRWRKAQEQAAAAEQYNAQKAQLDNKYNNGGLGGFLGQIVGNIGNSIGNIGYSLGGMFGTAGASIKDLLEGKAGTAENTRAFKRSYYGAKNDKDAAAKAAGTSLNAAVDLATTAVPGLGAGSKAAKVLSGTVANTVGGALGGVADEFAQQGQNATFEGAANRAISGGVAGLATGGLNKKIGNATSKAGSALLNNKLATSTIGRGALSGAVGGATGAGTSAALGGGDVAQAALQGGLTGAVSGATQAGLVSAASKIPSKIDSMRTNVINKNAVDRLANAIETGDDQTVKFARLDKNMLDDINTVRAAEGKMPITNRQARATIDSMNNHLAKHLDEFGSYQGIAQAAFDALTGRTSLAVPAKLSNTMVLNNNEGPTSSVVLDENTGIRSVSPRTENQTKKYVQNRNDILGSSLEGGNSPSSQLVSPETGLPISGSQTTNPIVSQSNKNVNSNLMYGDSTLANKTRRGQTAEALSRLGNTLEGAQTNITRAAARDLGIESPGKVIENVRRKTGITNLETQAQIARELTGGENSLMDQVQRRALSATEDGKPFTIDTSKLINEVEGIVDKYADSNTFGSRNKKEQFAQNLRRDINNGASDILTIANRMKSNAADLRGKGITDPKPADSAKAKIYTEIANKLDDLSYNSIPQENVNDMFDVTISELRGRAQQAQNNGNNATAKAYNLLAETLNKEPRTIKAFRSFKKDFVDAARINRLTGQAENGAAFQMGSSLAGGVKRGVNTLLQRPVNAALAKVGGAINTVADAVDNATPDTANITPTQPMSQNAQTTLGNYLGRSIGTQQASDAAQNARKAQEYQNLEDMFGDLMAQNAGTGSAMGLTGNYGMGGGYGAQTTGLNSITNQMNEISGAMNNALAAGDLTAYNQLASLYKSAYDTYKIQADMAGLGTSGTSNMSTTEKNQLAKLQSAGTALDQLEQLYQKAGGGQGIIGGNIANFLGGLGLNSDVNTYNQLAQGLINQIGAAIGKTDSLNTEGEVQRALSLVPKITDDNQTAMNKIATLRSLLQTNTGTYNQLYSA